MKPENAIDEDCEMKLLLEYFYLKKTTKKDISLCLHSRSHQRTFKNNEEHLETQINVYTIKDD